MIITVADGYECLRAIWPDAAESGSGRPACRGDLLQRRPRSSSKLGAAARISLVLARRRIVARQACYRPITRDGLPVIGPVAGLRGAYVATGHSVWGILNAPATGEAMAELIVDGQGAPVLLDAFDPGRFALRAV